MLSILHAEGLSRSDHVELLGEQLDGFFNVQISKFASNIPLMGIESTESLKNECLVKLDFVLDRFIYDYQITEKQNDLKFLAYLSISITRYFIDLIKRYSSRCRFSILEVYHIEEFEDDIEYVDYHLEYDRMIGELKCLLDGEQMKILQCMLSGSNITDTAIELGKPVARIGYVLNRHIRPKIFRYLRLCRCI